MNNYLDQLNEQQRAAVEYCDGPQLVIAGAGSGKTRVLTYKIVHLLHLGYSPARLMALTFTNKAAREMRERIDKVVGHQLASMLWMGTFHSIFARLLRINAERLGYKHDFTIYDQNDSRSLLKIIIADMQLDDKVYRPASVQSHISNMKNALILPEAYENSTNLRTADNDAGRPLIYKIYKTYRDRCFVAGAMDFDDLLVNMNILLRDHEDLLRKYQEMFQYILVDEYQDTNFAQHLIVQQLSRGHNRLCVVGDDAQSIYSFRGANIKNILSLERTFPDLRTFKLERNYRSTRNIIGAANSLIEKNKAQIAKHIYSENEQGTPIKVLRCLTDYEEAYVVANHITSLKARQGSSYSDFAVLYRTNAQSRVLEEALSNGGRRDKHGNVRNAIPYRIYGGLSFYQRKEIKDVVAYLRLTVNPNDDEALRRVINYPSRGIGDTTVSKVQTIAMQRQVSMWQVITHADQFELPVNRGTMRKLEDFAALIDGFMQVDKQTQNAYEVGRTIVERTQMLSMLMNDRTPENISRRENIIELVNGMHEFAENAIEEGEGHYALADYLAQVSLMTDLDQKESGDDCVTLMTVHSAKGLEFKNVVVVGVEEDLFPAAMSADTMSGIEEERRLLYVAITRAKTDCLLTYAGSRYRNGMTHTCLPSRFIRDIDPAFLKADSTSIFGGDEFGARHSQRFFPVETGSGSAVRRRNDTVTTPARRTPPRDVDSYPSADSVPRRPAAAPTGQFARHTVDEVHVGSEIIHKTFGHAVVVGIDAEGADAKIIAEFDALGRKTLLLKFAYIEILS